MTCTRHKGREHDIAQNETGEDNFTPLGDVACATQNVLRLQHADTFLNKKILIKYYNTSSPLTNLR